jgi:hypothetical protein
MNLIIIKIGQHEKVQFNSREFDGRVCFVTKLTHYWLRYDQWVY